MTKADLEQFEQFKLFMEQQNKEQEVNKNMKKPSNFFSKFIIIFVIVVNIVFSFYVLTIFKEIGNEPSVLIGAWFAFTTGELWILGRIQTKKIEKTPDNYNERRSMYDDTGAK